MNEDKTTSSEQDKSNDKKSLMLNAFLMGLFIGVIIYGVAKNNIGFFGLIPILIAFKIFNKPKN
ncbi:MAG: hypothetical protein AB8B80_05440 [Marinicellaceae bacterium]